MPILVAAFSSKKKKKIHSNVPVVCEQPKTVQKLPKLIDVSDFKSPWKMREWLRPDSEFHILICLHKIRSLKKLFRSPEIRIPCKFERSRISGTSENPQGPRGSFGDLRRLASEMLELVWLLERISLPSSRDDSLKSLRKLFLHPPFVGSRSLRFRTSFKSSQSWGHEMSKRRCRVSFA